MSVTLGRALRTFLPRALVFALLGDALLAVGVPPAYTLVPSSAWASSSWPASVTPPTPVSRWGGGDASRSEVVRRVACDECGGDAVWGVRRRYRRELVVFGTPVWTLATGENVYYRAYSDDPSLRTVDESSERGVKRDVEPERD